MLQRIHNSCFLLLWADCGLSGAGMAVVVVLMLVDTQLFPNLSNISRVDFEAILLLDILLDVVIAANPTGIGLPIRGVGCDTQMAADLLPA